MPWQMKSQSYKSIQFRTNHKACIDISKNLKDKVVISREAFIAQACSVESKNIVATENIKPGLPCGQSAYG